MGVEVAAEGVSAVWFSSLLRYCVVQAGGGPAVGGFVVELLYASSFSVSTSPYPYSNFAVVTESGGECVVVTGPWGCLCVAGMLVEDNKGVCEGAECIMDACEVVDAGWSTEVKGVGVSVGCEPSESAVVCVWGVCGDELTDT